jgi:hypothetical protein
MARELLPARSIDPGESFAVVQQHLQDMERGKLLVALTRGQAIAPTG